MTTTGWSSETFDDAPMSIVLGLLKYWGDNPPVHVIEAAKAGLGKRKVTLPQTNGPGEVRPPREMTEQEKIEESLLPTWVKAIRAKQREERRCQTKK